MTTIDYSKLLTLLEDASLFEIYRLTAALNNELQNPKRIKALRAQFKEGDMIEYFDANSNRLIKAKVHKKNPKNVSVINCHDGQHWRIPYHMLNLNSREIRFNQPGLSKNTLKVGDWVGFNRDGEEIVGQVQRLNQKTVTLITTNQQRWRVTYELLYQVIDGERFQPQTIEFVERED